MTLTLAALAFALESVGCTGQSYRRSDRGGVPLKLFLLGAGFSKAVSHHMPLVRDLAGPLADSFEDVPRQNQLLYSRFSEDPELLLTYLTQDTWKTLSQVRSDQSAFYTCTEIIRQVIAHAEERTFKQRPPAWCPSLLAYLHHTAANVATLNYDTVLERLARKLSVGDGEEGFLTDYMYMDTPVANIGLRKGSIWSPSRIQTFKLLKLHGSINWFYSGDDSVSGRPVYFVPLRRHVASPAEDLVEFEHLVSDLVPFIVPPVADKGRFLNSGVLKSTWSAFERALRTATEIYCVGYSLPKTDLTVRVLLEATAAAGQKTVYIVNTASPSDSLLENYQQVFRGCEVRDTYLGPDAVERMVQDLLDAVDSETRRPLFIPPWA